ncbi:GNAT family N-acetyltransferase [Streptomyces polyrhachis]|uniref:Lysine N-acyltransferase MbtK n=1 Tax=Streptomyces polyrhachis TaxID=1282885 RepID=A0ABW2GKS1_9ACTN
MSTPPSPSFTFRPVAPAADAPLLHRWVTHPKAGFWLMGESTAQEVESAYAAIDADPHHQAHLGLHDGRPAFLMERYDPAHRELTGVYEAQAGDIGMHFLVAPTDTPVHGFTRAVITAVLARLFADPAVRRVVVEPDVRNAAVQRLNAAVGFRVERPVTLPHKTAALSFCTRADFETARETARENARGAAV